jgi:anaerobic dimethyl sulfoxide reductase subunit A
LPPYDEFQSAGGHFYSAPTRYVAFRDQVTDPARHPFPTPSGKIEMYSETLAALNRPDIPPIPCYTPGFENSSDPRRETYPFQLIAWQSKRYCHSIHGNNPALDRIETPNVAINPADAASLGIADGTQVELWNDRGRLRIRARVTPDVMPGVLAIPAGIWYTPAKADDNDGVDTKGNVNTLTTSRPSPLSKGNPQHSILAALRPV